MLGAVKSLFKLIKSATSGSGDATPKDETEDADGDEYYNEDIGSTGSASSDTSGGGMKASGAANTGESTNDDSNSSETANDKFNRVEDLIKKKKAAGTTASELMNKFGQNAIDDELGTSEDTSTQSTEVAPGTSAAPTQKENGIDAPAIAPAAGPAVVVGPSSAGVESAGMGKAQQLLLDKLGWAGVTMVDLDHAASFIQDQSKGNVEGFVKHMVESPEFLNQVRKEYAPTLATDHPELGMSTEKNIVSTLNKSGVEGGVTLNRALAAALLGSVELNFGGMTFDASHPANTPTGRMSPEMASNSLTPGSGGAGIAPKAVGGVST